MSSASTSSHLSSITSIIEFLLREHSDEVAKVVEICRHISPSSFDTIPSSSIQTTYRIIMQSLTLENLSLLVFLKTLSNDTTYMNHFNQLVILYEQAQECDYVSVDVPKITKVIRSMLTHIRTCPTYSTWVSFWKKIWSYWTSELSSSIPSHIYNVKTRATIHSKLITLFISVIINSIVHFRKLRKWDDDVGLLNGFFTSQLRENPQSRILISSMLWYMVSAFMGIIIYYNAIFTNTEINLYRCGGEHGQWFLNICYVYIDHLIDGDVTLGYVSDAEKKKFLRYVQERLNRVIEPFDQPTALMHRICSDLERRIPQCIELSGNSIRRNEQTERIWNYIRRVFECEQIGIHLEKSSNHVDSLNEDKRDTLLSSLLIEKGMTTIYLSVLFVSYENELDLDELETCNNSKHSLYNISYKLGALSQYVDDLNDFHNDLEANSLTYAVYRYRTDGNLDRYIQEVNAYMSLVSDTVGEIPMTGWMLYVCQTGILYGCIKNNTYITSDTNMSVRKILKRHHIDEKQMMSIRQKKNTDGLSYLSNAFFNLK
jgi:hypothetical protein